jgi:hypothetical protein
MALTFTEKDGEMMRRLQADLTTVLLRANAQKVPAHIAAFALIRCVRPLVDIHGTQTKHMLCDLFDAFLRHAEVENDLLVN